MEFEKQLTNIFDEDVSGEINQSEDYNHARITDFPVELVPLYRSKLNISTYEYAFNETSRGPEFEVWEDIDETSVRP